MKTKLKSNISRYWVVDEPCCVVMAETLSEVFEIKNDGKIYLDGNAINYCPFCGKKIK